MVHCNGGPEVKKEPLKRNQFRKGMVLVRGRLLAHDKVSKSTHLEMGSALGDHFWLEIGMCFLGDLNY